MFVLYRVSLLSVVTARSMAGLANTRERGGDRLFVRVL